jgi:hypothetical protein
MPPGPHGMLRSKAYLPCWPSSPAASSSSSDPSRTGRGAPSFTSSPAISADGRASSGPPAGAADIIAWTTHLRASLPASAQQTRRPGPKTVARTPARAAGAHEVQGGQRERRETCDCGDSTVGAPVGSGPCSARLVALRPVSPVCANLLPVSPVLCAPKSNETNHFTSCTPPELKSSICSMVVSELNPN